MIFLIGKNNSLQIKMFWCQVIVIAYLCRTHCADFHINTKLKSELAENYPYMVYVMDLSEKVSLKIKS